MSDPTNLDMRINRYVLADHDQEMSCKTVSANGDDATETRRDFLYQGATVALALVNLLLIYDAYPTLDPFVRVYHTLLGIDHQSTFAFGDICRVEDFEPWVGYSFKSIMVMGHVAALAAGFGAVLFLDLYCLRYLFFKKVDAVGVELVRFGSKLVIWGLVGLWLTGLTFLIIYGFETPEKLTNPKVWTKVIVVLTLTINGVFIHRTFLPLLKAQQGKALLDGIDDKMRRSLFALGGISAGSWSFAMVLGLSSELNFTVPLQLLLFIYVLWLGVVVSSLFFVSRWAMTSSASLRAQRA